MFGLNKSRQMVGKKSRQANDTIEVAGLRHALNPGKLGFLTTKEVEPFSGLIGQDRGLEAVALGVDIRTDNFNIYAAGGLGVGKLTAITKLLQQTLPSWGAPSDWIYVNNFENSYQPIAIELSAGQGVEFRDLMIQSIDELRVGLSAMFHSDEYITRRRAIDLAFESNQEDAIDNLVEHARSKNVGILRTPSGFTMVPLEDGEPLEPEAFQAKPVGERRVVEAKIEALERQLAELFQSFPLQQKERAEKLIKLNADMAKNVVSAALMGVRKTFKKHDKITSYLKFVETDLIRHVGLFVDEQNDDVLVKGHVETEDDPKFRRYMVNVLVSHKRSELNGAPLVKEVNPTLSNLLGRIEAETGSSHGVGADFNMIKAGALHKANGGVLLIDAAKLLQNNFSWDGFKQALIDKEVRIASPIDDGSVLKPVSLSPEAIPLNVKVILFGEREIFYRLKEADPEFATIFKIQADFEDRVDRSDETEMQYAQIITGILKKKGLKPLDAVAVGRLIEESSRLAGDGEKLYINFVQLQDILIEADYLSSKDERKTTAHADIKMALSKREQRSSLVKERYRESIMRDLQMIETDGGVIGQINGLSVLQHGDYVFGRPNKITAQVRMGAGRVVDIEREVELGGPIHSKGVMILWGYLAGTYAQHVPLALSASLVFEQSYGGIDGDSASAAELFALLSALSQVPIRQGIAVTGSVNQQGGVQAIGGVNEKIEGYFDLCVARGLTGEQGVIIPHANRVHLMLREDVVAACGRGDFCIWSIEHIDEGLEILTGVKAGARTRNGAFEKGSLNRGVEARLTDFAHMRRAFGEGALS